MSDHDQAWDYFHRNNEVKWKVDEVLTNHYRHLTEPDRFRGGRVLKNPFAPSTAEVEQSAELLFLTYLASFNPLVSLGSMVPSDYDDATLPRSIVFAEHKLQQSFLEHAAPGSSGTDEEKELTSKRAAGHVIYHIRELLQERAKATQPTGTEMANGSYQIESQPPKPPELGA